MEDHVEIPLPPGPPFPYPVLTPRPILSIEDDLWRQLKDWWGPEASVDELGLLEQRAKITGEKPLSTLRRVVRYVVQNGLWG